MTIPEAIIILKEELNHTEQHLQFKDKSPEYYKEMQDIADALKTAIDCMLRLQGSGADMREDDI